MPPRSKYPGPQPPLKRSLDKINLKCPRPTKRHQLPRAPSTPNGTRDEVRPPSNLQAIPPHEDVDPAPNPSSNTRRVENWLASRPPIRAASCPPRLDDRDLLAISDPVENQRPLPEVLQEMSQFQGQRLGQTSTPYTRSSRLATSHPGYRSVLHNNGVHIDEKGSEIPLELQNFLGSAILKKRSSSLSSKAINEVVNIAIELADSPENNVYDLNGTAILPIKRQDIGRGGNTPWGIDGLPRKHAYDTALAQPKPDLHCGYPIGRRSTWTIEENAVVDHPHAQRLTQPARGNCFPYLVCELKSEAMGGNIWQAENQAAGSGACCVSAMRWLFQEAYGSQDQSIIDSIAFSVCVTHREVVIHVHHYCVAEDRYYMSLIGEFHTMSQVPECNNILRNILKYGQGTRQKKTRQALKQLYPFPKYWKKTLSASVMESQSPSADDDEVSNKRQRRTK